MKMIHKNRGAVYLVLLLVMSGVFIFLATAIMGLAFANLKLARHNESMVSSLSIAEAGVNYYLWHLSHAPTDFCDGHLNPDKTCSDSGPYEHDFTGPDGTVLGTFTLTITPPATGGTIYDIESVGTTAKNATVNRTVRAGIGIPSFAAYAILSDSNLWFEDAEHTDGPVRSNGGIRYDPRNANDTISSCQSSYIPNTVWGGDDVTSHNGVWSPEGGGPASYWQFPSKPCISFAGVTTDLTGPNGLQDASETPEGINLPLFAHSDPNKDALGYYLKLKADGNIGMAAVTAEDINSITIKNSDGTEINPDQAANLTIPANFNGILYSEKPIWIEGTWNNRITIATATNISSRGWSGTGSNPTSIIIVGNLKYGESPESGTNKIGLIGEKDIRIALCAPDDLEIDAAMLSRDGYVISDYLNDHIHTILKIYGSIASGKGSSFQWTGGGGAVVGGYRNVNQIYDRNLTIDPPPNFPTTGDYQVLTWREE